MGCLKRCLDAEASGRCQSYAPAFSVNNQPGLRCDRPYRVDINRKQESERARRKQGSPTHLMSWRSLGLESLSRFLHYMLPVHARDIRKEVLP
jgi:hypothetical protein